MFRNDVVMTPLRVKQAIDSRFVKSSEDELNVLINGTWVEFIKVIVVDCAELLTMFKGDTTLTESPAINATGCTSLNSVFSGCTKLKTVKYIHMPNVTDMRFTFNRCSSLTTIPALDTSSVTNMGAMFQWCSSLKTIPALDTSSVTDMSSMLNRCSSLTSVPKMITSNVSDMYGMFGNCSSLRSIPEINMSNVTDTRYMFNGCSSLTSVSFTGNVVPPYGAHMFDVTPIASGNGYIFVPDNMVNTYKTDEGWSTHASVIRGISQKGALQSNINMYNKQIEENPTMFAMTEEEELEMLIDMEEDSITGMKKWK